MTHIALEVANILSNEGIDLGVVNMSSIKPIDRELIEALAYRYRYLISCEDHNIIGGLGSAILEALPYMNSRLIRIGIEDTFGDSGRFEELLEYYKLDPLSITYKIKEVMVSDRV
jgi:transketolase